MSNDIRNYGDYVKPPILTAYQKEAIAELFSCGVSMSLCAQKIGCNKSQVSRAIRTLRNNLYDFNKYGKRPSVYGNRTKRVNVGGSEPEYVNKEPSKITLPYIPPPRS